MKKIQLTNASKNQSCFKDLLMENKTENIARLKENKEEYEDPKEMSEVLNKNFQKVFTTEFDFKMPQGQVRKNETWEIRISKNEIEEIMKKLDERKAIGPDEV